MDGCHPDTTMQFPHHTRHHAQAKLALQRQRRALGRNGPYLPEKAWRDSLKAIQKGKVSLSDHFYPSQNPFEGRIAELEYKVQLEPRGHDDSPIHKDESMVDVGQGVSGEDTMFGVLTYKTCSCQFRTKMISTM